MAPKLWAMTEQQAWLRLKIPDYIRYGEELRLNFFWRALHEEWFRTFPEETELGLPLLSDDGAPVLTSEQVKALHEAVAARKKMLANWFKREHQRIRNGNAQG
ncbi:hypothetical protein C8R44DRAFT_890497 [Mycena epipterygia]|nr:hypothetical protein C8R44DRAFT_890497 [Mycena epipterygia]